MLRAQFLILQLTVAGLLCGQQQPSVPTSELLASEYQEVISLLQSDYADTHAVSRERVSEAALQGVLQRLRGGAMILAQPSLSGSADPPVLERLESGFGYIGLASFRLNLDGLARTIRQWAAGGCWGIIIDLRDFQASNGFENAAEFLSLFIGDGEILFSIQGLQIPQQIFKSERRASIFSGPIVVVTNHRTRGAAEVVARVMKDRVAAILVGKSTAGQAALYTEKRLCSGRYLRLASGRATLPNGKSLYGTPVAPDVLVRTAQAADIKALLAIRQRDLKIQELTEELPTRARLSEAALVRQHNPEIDRALEVQTIAEQSQLEELRDETLVRALDVLRAINLSHSEEVLPETPVRIQ